MKVTPEAYIDTETGVAYDRVSYILKVLDDGMTPWKLEVGKKEADRKRKEATNIGTRVHEIIQQEIMGNPIKKFKKTDGSGVRNCVEAFRRMIRDRGGLPTNMILDFKTSGAMGPDKMDRKHFLQLGAYWHAYYEMRNTMGMGRVGFGSEVFLRSERFMYAGTADYIADDGSGPMDIAVVYLDKDLANYKIQRSEFTAESCANFFKDVLGIFRYMKGQYGATDSKK